MSDIRPHKVSLGTGCQKQRVRVEAENTQTLLSPQSVFWQEIQVRCAELAAVTRVVRGQTHSFRDDLSISMVRPTNIISFPILAT